MSSATSAVTYTSVYTDSKPGRAFWGADDEEISEGGIPRVIVLGYDGLPMQPVAPPSPDYIPGPEDPQTPPVPQDEDEREPMFVQAHDPDYVPEPIYPEYIPLEDEHEFPAEEQPLPPVDSPTAESPGYVTESDPEEDPEEYEDDETEDGPVDYPMDGGDDGDDDDGDSSRDDANDEDEDDKDEEEEHLALADSAIVVPIDEPIFPLLQHYHYLHYHHYYHHYTYHHLYEVGESSTARPTRGRGIDYGFVSTVDAEERRQGIRDVGYDIRDTWVDPVEAVPEIAPMTVGEVNTRVTEFAELHDHDTQDLYALLKDAQHRDSMDGGGGGLSFPRGLGSLDRIKSGTLIQTQHQVHETRFQMQQAELAALRETDRRRQAQMVETLRVIRDMRREMSDMQAELLALREQQRRARQPGPKARIPDHQDASGDADSHIQ
ncbi:hypothetical protein Tco_1438637 [Tanacetum coccineum]